MENKIPPEVGTRFKDKNGQIWIFAYAKHGGPIVINVETGGIGGWFDKKSLFDIKE